MLDVVVDEIEEERNKLSGVCVRVLMERSWMSCWVGIGRCFRMCRETLQRWL